MEYYGILQPKYSSFNSLAAELRVQVYKCILYADSTLPGQRKLSDYRGLILSCKEIKTNFEHEWVKAFNQTVRTLLSNLTLPTALHLSPVSKFEDLNDIRFTIPEEPYLPTTNWLRPDIKSALKSMIVDLKSFSFYPAPQSDYFRSRPHIYLWFLILRRIIQDFMNRESGNFDVRLRNIERIVREYGIKVLPTLVVRTRGSGLVLELPHIGVVERFEGVFEVEV